MGKFIAYLLLTIVVFPSGIAAQTASGRENPEAWNAPFASAEELLAVYRRHTVPDVWNDCYFIWHSGKYVSDGNGKRTDAALLLEHLPEIGLEREEVSAFVREHDASHFVDAYFMLRALKEGASFDEARDGLVVTTCFPERPLNAYDYRKLRAVLSSRNPSLQSAYLQKMKFLFGRHGCTPELAEMLPLVQEFCAPSALKDEILKLYRQYGRIAAGQPAPAAMFYDEAGREVKLEDYRGRIVVLDVWATWCCSCIEKMPAYAALAERFRSDGKVAFLAVSIDTDKKKELWQEKIRTFRPDVLVHVIAPESRSSFCADYFIAGVPRYLIIGRKGEVIDAFSSLSAIERTLYQMIETK